MGGRGTHFEVDPKEQMAGILLIQRSLNASLNRDFEERRHAAIIDRHVRN